MAAYHQVFDLSHLWVDCLYTGISSGPKPGNEYGKFLPFLLASSERAQQCRNKTEGIFHQESNGERRKDKASM